LLTYLKGGRHPDLDEAQALVLVTLSYRSAALIHRAHHGHNHNHNHDLTIPSKHDRQFARPAYSFLSVVEREIQVGVEMRSEPIAVEDMNDMRPGAQR
jgi:hypothetical protein